MDQVKLENRKLEFKIDEHKFGNKSTKGDKTWPNQADQHSQSSTRDIR